MANPLKSHRPCPEHTVAPTCGHNADVQCTPVSFPATASGSFKRGRAEPRELHKSSDFARCSPNPPTDSGTNRADHFATSS